MPATGPGKPGETVTAALAYVLAPVWVIPLLLAGWGYLVTGTGGQDASLFRPVVATYAVITPYSMQDGVSWGLSIVYALIVGLPALFLLMLFVGGPPFVKLHARRALLFSAVLVPAVLALPYVTGVVAALPMGGFSVMRGDEVVATPLGVIARRGSAFAFPGILLALLSVYKWQEGIRQALAGQPTAPLGRRFWIFLAVFAVISFLIVLGGIFKPL